MTILLFVLTAVLVCYVVYTFCSSDAGKVPSELPKAKPKAQPKAKPKAVKKPAPPKKAGPKEKKKPANPVPDPTQYRDPKTGGTAAVPSNYRFAKRWIKEALITEGLLDKVYKNNELDDKGSKKVKGALDKFKTIKKYHA